MSAETMTTPTPTPAPPPAPAPAPAPQTVTIPLEQLQAFTSVQARLAEMEADQRRQQEAAQQEQARILAQKGEVENALRILREQSETTLNAERRRAAAIEQDAARYALDGELARALAAQPNLVENGAEQLTDLWRSNFSAVRENGTFAVRTPTFETPAQFVARNLADPKFAHFLRAGSQGGTAAGQAPQAVQTGTPTPTPAPQNMGQAVILHMQGLQKAQGNPLESMALPMGLRRSAT
jgi:hypothetical protein